MKKEQVKVGGTYTAKVTGGLAQVRITEEKWQGDKHVGWVGVNTATKRAVRIKSAQRLRAAVTPKADAAGSDDVASETAKGHATKGKARKQVRPVPGKRAAKPKADRPLSGLDAAAKVLAGSGEPMRVSDLVEAMEKKGLWKSKAGKTPAATVYAAIIREIRDKGVESRFVKKDRGLFASAGK